MDTNKVKVMFFSDIHYTGIMPDAMKRLRDIIDAAYREEADCIICLGDTAWATEEFKDIADLWNSITIPHYMIYGNHDLDRNSKEEFRKYYNIPADYYSFDVKGLHFAALDTNFYIKDDGSGDTKMYDYCCASYAGQITDCFSPEEMQWLRKDTESTQKPIVLLSHSPLCKNEDEDHYCKQYKELHEFIMSHNEKAGEKQIFMSCHGHSHVDSYFNWEGIHHLGINSASNQWLGEDCELLEPGEVFSEEDFENYGCLKYVAPYKDAVYALITFDTKERTVYVKPCISEYIGKTPVERGCTAKICGAYHSAATQERHLDF